MDVPEEVSRRIAVSSIVYDLSRTWPDDPNLPALLLRLQTSLAALKLSDLGDISRELRLAKFSDLKHNDTTRMFTRLILRIHPSGTALLETVIAGSLYKVATVLIEDRFAEVAQGGLKWLHEVKDMGYSTKDMLGFLQKTDPWVPSDDANPEGDDPRELDPNLHHDHCVRS